MRILLDDNAFIPCRAHDDDAGLDLMATNDAMIAPRDSYIFDTGVHVELPSGTCGVLISKSGLNIKESITSEGLIDCGYTGSIKVKLYNNSDEWKRVKRGDKITQLVVMPYLKETIDIVKTLNETDRGDNGFGSSGR